MIKLDVEVKEELEITMDDHEEDLYYKLWEDDRL